MTVRGQFQPHYLRIGQVGDPICLNCNYDEPDNPKHRLGRYTYKPSRQNHWTLIHSDYGNWTITNHRPQNIRRDLEGMELEDLIDFITAILEALIDNGTRVSRSGRL